MEKEFIPYTLALELKELGFDEPCFNTYNLDKKVSRNPSHNMEDLPIEGQPYYWQNSKIHVSCITAPTFSQAINFLYICSNKQIDIELKASDTYEERLRKITKGCEDLRNLQNNKSN